jgi:hypothetical protein
VENHKIPPNEKPRQNYEQIKAQAEALGVSYKHLIALSKTNDPFYVGTDRHLRMAEWFAAAWEEKGFVGRGGVHLRRAHYQLLNSPRHDGRRYENTESHFSYLIDASRYARLLGLVDPEDIIDRRNPQPHIFLERPEYEEEIGYEVEDDDPPELPSVDTDLVSKVEEATEPPHLLPTGYAYNPFYQPYHVEVWAEKSTMNDVLEPTCKRLNTNLVTGLGYLTITAIVALLRRIEANRKPARILYVSDLDKAGMNMPKQVARQCEFWLKKYLPEADIRLQPIVLTEEQVDEYELWEKAIRNEETGEETYELDALEALHEGALGSIVREHIRKFRDPDLLVKYYAAGEEAAQALEEALEEEAGEHLEALEEIREEARIIVESYQEQLTPIAEQMAEELAPLQERLNEVRQSHNQFRNQPRR